MQLSEIIPESHVLLNLSARSKHDVFVALVKPLVSDFDSESLLTAMVKREELGSTGVGWGVAVPHVRLDEVETPVVVFAHLNKPIDFAAIDDEPCDIFFLVLAPSRKEEQDKYLQIMARISRLMRDKDVRDSLIKANGPAQVLEIIRSH